MKIGKFDTDMSVLIIAEIGNNHEGSFERAKQMICMAAEAGADAVKFQTIQPELLVSRDQKDRISNLKRFQLTQEQFRELAKTAGEQGVIFLSTPFDLDSVRFLDSLVPVFKIASGDNTFFPLLNEIAKTGKPVILSAGLVSFEEISVSINYIYKQWEQLGLKSQLAVLHCVSSYPTLPEDANLLSIEKLKTFGATIGYSDHTLGIEAAVLSVAIGARIIEKHFTLDKTLSDFRDHSLSADPDDFRHLVSQVRLAEKMLGKGDKNPSASELSDKMNIRRSVAAKTDLEKGKRLEMKDICWVRPGIGIPPGEENKIIGQILKTPKKMGEIIYIDDLDSII